MTNHKNKSLFGVVVNYIDYVISHAYHNVLGSILYAPVFFFLYKTIVLLVRWLAVRLGG